MSTRRPHDGAPAKPPYKRQHYWVDAPLQVQIVGYVLFVLSIALFLAAFTVYRGIQEAAASSLQLVFSLEWILAALRGPFFLASAISLLAGALISLFWSHRFAGPLRVLSAGMARVRHGNLAVPVRVRTTDAHQNLAREFTAMQQELRRMVQEDRERLALAAAKLESALERLKDRPEAAAEIGQALESLRKACAQFHL